MHKKNMLFKLFEEIAAANPEGIAVQCEERTVSFHNLNLHADQLAAYLLKQGCGKGRPVGLLLEHNEDIPLAVLAVHKIGAYYIPLSRDLPPQRIHEILNDSGCRTLLHNFPVSLSEGVQTIDLCQTQNWKTEASQFAQPDLQTDDLAYVMYTSGSTGRPKGVRITHGNLSYYVNWYLGHLAVLHNGHLPMTASFQFAAAVKQLYAPLVQGETLHILPPDLSRDSRQLFRWYASHPGFGAHLTPSVWEEHLRYAENQQVSPPEFVLFSGEALKKQLLDRTWKRFPELPVWNLYGPTETVANITCIRLRPDDSEVSIGRALEGSRALVLNGELCVSGPGVTPGYLHDDKPNSENFTVVDGVRYYKTGDFVRQRHDGCFVYVGRKDRQVKVNGIRIELQEVEQALNDLDGIRESAVLVDEPDEYEKNLVAFVVTEADLTEAEYREALQKRLPPYAVPMRFFALETFPRLGNGKVDLGALRQSLRQRHADQGKDRLASVLCDLLQLDQIGEQDNIFDLGANSMTVIRLVNRLSAYFENTVPITDVYSNPTPAALRRLLGKARLQPSPATDTEQQSVEAVPLALNQQTLWVAHQTREVKHSYNIIFSIHWPEVKFDKDGMRNILKRLVENNDVLRSIFTYEDGKVVRKILAFPPLPFVVQQVHSRTDRDRLIETFNVNLLEESQTPPVRFLFLQYGTHEAELVVIINHIIFDGFSIGVFARKLMDLLKEDPTVRPLAGEQNYTAFVHKQQKYLQSDRFRSSLNYWVEKLRSDSYLLNLPTDFLRPKQQSFLGETEQLRIDSERKSRMQNYCRKKSLSLFQLLLSAYGILLHKYSGQKDLLIAFPYAGRDELHFEDVLGYFVNVVLHRSKVFDKDKLYDIVQRCNQSVLEDMPHWDCPVEEIFKKLEVSSEAATNPLFQVMFAWHEQLPGQKSAKKLAFEVEELPNHSAKLDLFLEAQDEENTILLKFNYATSLFTPERIRRFGDDFLKILDYIVEKDDTRYRDFTLATSDEIKQIARWNNTKYDHKDPLILYRLFAETVSKYGKNTALKSPEGEITYNRLNDLVEEYASFLHAKDLRAGQWIGVAVRPGVEMMVSLLAVMRLGATYVPLDPGYPHKRLKYIIEHAGIAALISDQNDDYGSGVQVISSKPEGASATSAPKPETTESDLLYVIYTSGSTGNSKGVPVPNRGVANFLLWMKNRFEVTAADSFLHQTSINFDISVCEIFLPLISGARLVIPAHERLRSGDLVHGAIRQNNISIAQFVPSALWEFVSTAPENPKTRLRLTMVGGERLVDELKNSFFERIDSRLVNLYGPTETSIYSTFCCCQAGSGQPVNIGKPIYNTSIHILDEYGNHLPIGAQGEIFISGMGLANDYVNNPEESKKRFVYHDSLKIRMFRTGDLGSYRPDGVIEFWGRKDKQVKVRGFRIELSEIENAISQLDGIEEVSVLVHEISATDKRIVAFYSGNGSLPKKSAVREHLKSHLPAYMLPSELVQMEKMERLPNGKIDNRKLLGSLNTRPDKNKSKAREVFLDSVEEKIRWVWERVLGKSDFGPEDNFFDVGGHSLLVLEVKKLIEEHLDKSIPLVDLYKYNNIRSLAKAFMEDENNSEMVNEIRRRLANRKNRQVRKIRN